MSGFEPFDVGDDLAPHISFFMRVSGFFFGQPVSRATASRHVEKKERKKERKKWVNVLREGSADFSNGPHTGPNSNYEAWGGLP